MLRSVLRFQICASAVTATAMRRHDRRRQHAAQIDHNARQGALAKDGERQKAHGNGHERRDRDDEDGMAHCSPSNLPRSAASMATAAMRAMSRKLSGPKSSRAATAQVRPVSAGTCEGNCFH